MNKWYAVQVVAGQEQAVCDFVTQIAEATGISDALDELFTPKRKTLRMSKGELIEGMEPLLPGYIIAVCRPANLDLLDKALRSSPKFAKLIGRYEREFVPLSDEEVSWICAFTRRENRVVEMSEGFIEGGCVKVTAGPLVGKEGLIRKINRRKRTAYLSFQILGRTVETKVGLNLVKNVN